MTTEERRAHLLSLGFVEGAIVFASQGEPRVIRWVGNIISALHIYDETKVGMTDNISNESSARRFTREYTV